MPKSSREIMTKVIDAWKSEDFNKLYRLSQISWKSGLSKSQARHTLNLSLFGAKIRSANIVHVDQITDVIHTIVLKVTFLKKDMDNGLYSVNLICEKSAYNPSKDGTWGFNPSSIRKLDEQPKDRPVGQTG